MSQQFPVLRYLTHPQVVIDPAVPVSEWGLSAVGRQRTEALSRSASLADTCRVVSSAEVKATETATILASALGLIVEIRPEMHENDRSATGFLDAAAFEAAADRFFSDPMASVHGWERASDAQARIVAASEAVLAEHGAGDLLMVGHGAVGTLLLCHYAGLAIDRAHDQAAGGGNFFTVAIGDRHVQHGWRPMEVM